MNKNIIKDIRKKFRKEVKIIIKAIASNKGKSIIGLSLFLTISLVTAGVLTGFFVPGGSVIAATTIYGVDSFGSSDTNTVTGWTDSDGSGGGAVIKTDADRRRTGSPTIGFVKLKEKTSSITQTSISTSGYQNIHLIYYWRGKSSETGDQLIVEWKKSSDSVYLNLATHDLNDETWSDPSEDIALPVAAENTSIDIRFRLNADANNDEGLIDDVSVEGIVVDTTLTINKICVPSDDTGKFNLKIDSTINGADASCGGTTGAVTVTADSHTVSETAGTSTNLSDYTSVIGGDCAADGSITLAGGENKVCTITNTKLPKLTVTKVVVIDNGGTKQVSDFPLKIDSTTVISGVQNTSTIGSHIVSETSDPNYTATITGDCDAQGNITLVAGDVKTCTITNDDQPGHLTIVKNTVGGDGNFLFTVGGLSASTQFISTSNLTGTTGAFAVNAGTYSIAEGGSGSWDLTSASCDDGSSLLSGSTVSGINVSLGANVICTFTNTKKGSITVSKNVVAPQAEMDVFDSHPFNVILDGGNQKTISEGASKTYSELTPRTYTVAEIGDPDFDLLRITVGGVDDPTPQDGAPVVVTAGQNTDVTIINGQRQAHLTVRKIVNNPNGGTAVPSDFTMTIGLTNASPSSFPGTDDISGTVVALDPGAFEVGESGPAGYSLYSADGNCSGTIGSNENLTCTITNSDIPLGYGAITIIKNVVSDNGGNLGADAFTTHVEYDESDVEGSPAAGSESGVLYTLEADNSYTVSEDDPTLQGYSETGISCAPVSGGEPLIGQSVQIDLADQQAYICTVTNDDIAPKLTLIKSVDNGEGVGSATSDQWTLSAEGPTDISGISGSEDVTNASVNVGTYTLSESGGPNGYTPSETWSCVVNDGDSIFENSIQLGLGDVATCTITNTAQPASLTIIKNTDQASGDGIFHFTVTQGDATIASQDITTVNGVGPTELVQLNLSAGSYNVNEVNIPEGWRLVSTNCVYDNHSIGEPIAGGEQITVGNGDNVTCTFTNTTQGTLIVKKVVINDNGGTKTAGDFSFVIGDGSSTPFTQNGENNLLGQNNISESAGTYIITEPAVAGYATTYDNCSEINVVAGGEATCTITNDDIQPKLTVTKIVINDNGGTKAVADFPLFVGQTSVASGQQNGFDTGTYTISETNQAGYTSAITGDCAVDGTITLNIGDVKSCTITNNDIAPQQVAISGGGGGGGGGGGAPAEPALIISNLNSPDVTTTTLTLTWTTSFASSSYVIYSAEGEPHSLDMTDNTGNPPKYGYAHTTPEIDTDPKVTFHTVTITGLNPLTTYYFRVVSRGSLAVGGEYKITMPSVAGAQVAVGSLGGETANVGTIEQGAAPSSTPQIELVEGTQPVSQPTENSTGANISPTSEEGQGNQTSNNPNLFVVSLLSVASDYFWWLLIIFVIAVIGYGIYYLVNKNKKQ